jgi:hypothetical protein
MRLHINLSSRGNFEKHRVAYPTPVLLNSLSFDLCIQGYEIIRPVEKDLITASSSVCLATEMASLINAGIFRHQLLLYVLIE